MKLYCKALSSSYSLPFSLVLQQQIRFDLMMGSLMQAAKNLKQNIVSHVQMVKELESKQEKRHKSTIYWLTYNFYPERELGGSL